MPYDLVENERQWYLNNVFLDSLTSILSCLSFMYIKALNISLSFASIDEHTYVHVYLLVTIGIIW